MTISVEHSEFLGLLAALNDLSAFPGTNTDDSVENVIFSGENNFSLELSDHLTDALRQFEACQALDYTKLEIEGFATKLEELKSDQDIEPKLGLSWNLLVAKRPIWKNFQVGKYNAQPYFYIDTERYQAWLSSIDPLFSGEFPFSPGRKIAVYAPGNFLAFGGTSLWVTPFNSKNAAEPNFDDSCQLPDEKAIRENAHVIPSQPLVVSPRRFHLCYGELTSEHAQTFQNLYVVALAASLVDVAYGSERVIVKGLRHLDIPLVSEHDGSFTPTQVTFIEEAVKWAFEERVSTRKKLLADRLSIEAQENESWTEIIRRNISCALPQAKDQYRFVLLDRKDEYAKEVRNLLSDVKDQSELYAAKTRELIGGLLRDSLAALLLVGLTMMVRLRPQAAPYSESLVALFFQALGIYFFTAGLLQTAAACRDIKLAEREFDRWGEITREYIDRRSFDKWKLENIKPRKITFKIFSYLIIAIYSSLAIVSYNISDVLAFLEVGVK